MRPPRQVGVAFLKQTFAASISHDSRRSLFWLVVFVAKAPSPLATAGSVASTHPRVNYHQAPPGIPPRRSWWSIASADARTRYRKRGGSISLTAFFLSGYFGIVVGIADNPSARFVMIVNFWARGRQPSAGIHPKSPSLRLSSTRIVWCLPLKRRVALRAPHQTNSESVLTQQSSRVLECEQGVAYHP